MTTPQAPAWHIKPVGDRCLLISFGEKIDARTNGLVHGAAAYFLAHDVPGIVDVVPSFTTLALHYLPEAFNAPKGTPFEHISSLVAQVLRSGVSSAVQETARTVEIPVCYGGRYGPDLEEVAERCKLSPEDVIKLHGQSPLVVYTFYFAPGNPFAGGLDPRLSVPRRQSPRTHVPAGSVAIANSLTSIYQLEMPGGWNLIGRTPWNLFDLSQDPPNRLRLGDRLVFVPITEAQFAELEEARP